MFMPWFVSRLFSENMNLMNWGIALNAMANHGILPHDGRNIKFTELSKLIHETYNFAPSFCYFVPNYAADFLGRDYKTDTMDLNDLDVHNCIEHDASLTRTSPPPLPLLSVEGFFEGFWTDGCGCGG